MSYPRIRPYPQNGAITIANGEELPVTIGGNFIRVREADQTFKILLDSDVELKAEQNDVFRLTDGDKFKKLTVINNSGVSLTFQLEVGEGGVETNNVAISGTVSTSDTTSHTKLDTLEASLTVLDVYLYAIREMIRGKEASGGEFATKGYVNLKGSSYYSAANTTTTVISAAANTGGFIICSAPWFNGSSPHVRVLVDGNPLHPSSSPSAGEIYHGTIENYLVDVGSKVEIVSNNAGVTASMWGKAL